MSRSVKLLCLPAVAVAVAAITALAPAASAAPVSQARPALTNVYTVRTRLPATSGKNLCLDADANHAGTGTAVNTVVCNGSKYQQWQVGTVNNYEVWINVGHPGYALAATSLAVGAAMELKPAASANSTYGYTVDVLGDESFTFYSQANHALVLQQSSYAGGTRVFLRARVKPALWADQAWIETRIS